MLDTYTSGGGTDLCKSYLSRLPSTCLDLSKLGPRATLARVCWHLGVCLHSPQQFPRCNVDTVPYWLCHIYQICVLTEAVSRSTSLPVTFYVDSLRCTAAPVVTPHVIARGSGGVEDPGTGKTHAADPHVQLAIEASEQCDGYAVGEKHDRLNVIIARTYAAFEDKLSSTGGYGPVLTGEGHHLLCPAYLTKGHFEDSKGLRFDRMMDTAYGEQAKRARKSGKAVNGMYHKPQMWASGIDTR